MKQKKSKKIVYVKPCMTVFKALILILRLEKRLDALESKLSVVHYDS